MVSDKMLDEQTAVTPNVLTYKARNHELNELHRSFNSVAKTMMIAHDQGDDIEMALLNYSDAYFIEQYEQDESHKGICLSNIGMLMIQKEEYMMASACFKISCEM